jgi:hypothetical protein
MKLYGKNLLSLVVTAAFFAMSALPAKAQSYSLTLTTTNSVGAPLSSFNLLFDAASASLQLSNSATRIYLLSGSGQLSDDGIDYSFDGLRLRYGLLGRGFIFFITNSVSTNWLNLTLFYPTNVFTTFSMAEAMGILQDGSLGRMTQRLTLNGGAAEEIAFFNLAEVPEPDAILLAGAGGVTAALWHRFGNHRRRSV